jgi:hypothetical protein
MADEEHMADEEQLRILQQGVEAWNAWRQEAGRGARIDLRDANLSGARLHRADLRRAYLMIRGCCFSREWRRQCKTQNSAP